MNFVRVEDEIQLANILEHVVERFNHDVNEVEYTQLTFALVDHEDEDERGVHSVNHLGSLAEARVLDEVADAVRPLRHHPEKVLDDVLLLGDGDGRVELAEANLAVVVDHDDGLDHGSGASVRARP
jgi:hypothetical protein